MEFKYIQKTALYRAFSELGKRIILPDGIFYWSEKAKKEAEINGTIGSAVAFEKDFIQGGNDEWITCYLSEIKKYASLGIKNMVPYVAIGGLSDIRAIWKNWIIRKALYNNSADKNKIERLNKYISNPLITAGVTNGIFSSCSLFLSPGEYIIAPNKRWENYDTIIRNFIGADIKSFEFFKEGKINIEGLKDAIKYVAKLQEKIVILLNFPNNPTGYVPTKEEAKKIVDLLEESQNEFNKPIIVLVDDAYEPYVYDDNVIPNSIFYDLHQLDGDIIPIKLDGVTKELLMYGARIGFITIGLKPKWVKNENELESLKKEINNKLEAINRGTISNCNQFYQAVAQKIFSEEGFDKILKSRGNVHKLLKERYDLINSEFKKILNPNISVDPNAGGFFLFLNLNPQKYNATNFAHHLIEKYKVGIIPTDNPEDNINGIRIAYCSIDKNKIPDFVNRIKLALDDF